MAPSTIVSEYHPIELSMSKIPVDFMFVPLKTGVRIQIRVADAEDEDDEVFDEQSHNFHIHNGNCQNFKEHWDPHRAKHNSTYSCNGKGLDECEAGDLNGKFGGISSKISSYVFFDPTISFEEIVDGKLCVVVHQPGNRAAETLDCADIEYN